MVKFDITNDQPCPSVCGRMQGLVTKSISNRVGSYSTERLGGKRDVSMTERGG
jgi:hypothetical protein